MTDRSLRESLNALVADEPPLRADITPVVHEGARLRRRRRIGYAGITLGVIAVVSAAVAVPLALSSGDDEATIAVKPFALTGTDGGFGAAPTGTEQQPLTAKQQAIADAISAASPQGWTFELSADRWDGNRDVEGVVNDGTGDGRILLGVSKPVGSQQVHPCEDRACSYSAGVRCFSRIMPRMACMAVSGVRNSCEASLVN